MALTGTAQLVAQDIKNGNANNFNALQDLIESNGANYSNNSNYNSVKPGQEVKSTYPVEQYQNKTDYVPDSVTQAQRNLNLRSLPTQAYANQVQADLIADYHGYKTDKNYKGKYTSAEALQGYDYLSRANNGASDLNWTAPKADDQLFTHIAPRWDAAREINEAANAQFNISVDRDDSILRSALGGTNLTQAQKDVINAKDIERGDWNALNWIDKAKALFVPGSSGTNSMANLPSWAKYITNIFPSIMASGAGAAIGSAIAPGIGTGIGALTVGGLSYIQGVTGHEIPVINELLYGMDILSIWTEKAQGAIGAASKETWKRATEDGSTDLLELGRTMGEILKDLPDLWEVSELSYEVGADLGLDNTLNAIRNAGASVSDSVFGTEFGQYDTNTVSRANIGLGGLIDVNPETRGYDALYNVYMPLYQKIRDEAEANGYDHKEAGQLAMQYLQENVDKLMGTTGLANDFGASAILDPMNLAPYIQAKGADIIANKTGDTALKAAARAALEGSSPIVDMFSVPILEQVSEFITGKHSTQGLDTIRRVYAQELQSKMPVEKLSDFQKRIAGITNDGVIKSFENETNPIKKWFGLTEEAKMYKLSELTSNLLGSIMFDPNLNTDLGSIPELISQFAGISPITKDSPLAQFQNSAVANTLKQTMSKMTADDIQKFQKQVDTFRQYNANRIMLNLVSEKLGMKVDEIFNYIDNPEKTIDLYKKIKDAGITWIDPVSGIIYSSDQVTDALKVFADEGSSDNKTYYSADNLKAHIMEEVFKKAEIGMFERYPNIKPDKWFNRLSRMMNSAQSIALLNFSPSYFVNNAINNVLTRSIVGTGGAATGKIKTANERRGLSYTRDGNFYEKVSNAINAKHNEGDGLIQRAKQTFDKIADNKILKGFKNIDIESLETQNAYNIGANRYWEATWKPGLNLPEVPKEWKALGFTDEMNNTIYKAAMDSATLAEFKQKIGGEIILPGAKSTFFDMLKNNYSESNGKMMENLFSAFPWISDKVDAALQSGDPKTIEATFNGIIRELTNDIRIKNIIQVDSEFNNLVTLFAGSGIPEMASNREALYGAFCDIWVNQSLDSENLFAERILKNIGTEEFDKMYEAHMQRMQTDYNMIRKYEVMHTAAMIAGLGLKEDLAKSLMVATLQQFDLEAKYIDEEHKLFQKYVRGDNPDFDYYRQAKLEMCQKVFDMKQEASRVQEQIIIDYLRENLDPSYTGKIDTYEENIKHWLDLKQELNVKEMEWLNERLNDPDIAHKDKVERIDPAHNTERRIYKENIKKHYEDWVAPSFQELKGGMEKTGSQNKIQLDIAQTLAIELMYREAHITEQNTSEFLSHFIDKSDPQKVFDPINFANNMEGTFIDNAHRNASPDDLHKIEIIYNQGDAVPLGAKDIRNRVLPDDYIEQPITGRSEQTTPISNQINPDIDYRGSKEIFDQLPESIQKSLKSDQTSDLKNYNQALDALTKWADNETKDLLNAISNEHNIDQNLKDQIACLIEDQTKIDLNIKESRPGFNLDYINENIGNYSDAIDQLCDRINNIKDNIEKYTGIESSYHLERNNLEKIAIRAGANESVAKAFSKYMNLVADKWEANNPGKDFFKDSNMNLNIEFHNIQSQRSDSILGSYDSINKFINIYKSGNFETFIHELGHGFEYTLDENQSRALAQYLGMSYEDYMRIRLADENNAELSDSDNILRTDAAEIFARGFVDYIFNNKSPNSTISHIFDSFRKFITEIFPSFERFIQKALSYVSGYDFINSNPEDLFTIHADEIKNGTSLQKIFETFIDEELNQTDIPQEYIDSANNKKSPKQHQVSYSDLKNVYNDTTTEYKPFKENFKQLTPQNPGEHTLSQVRCHPFIYGDSYARAGVYYDGKLIAYITDTIPDTIEVSGYSFPVIGKDINNPDAMWIYVANKPTLVNPGHPKDVDYTIFAESGDHPMRYGTLPTTEPWGMASWETSLPMREALNHWKDTAIDSLLKSNEDGSFMKKLTPDQQKAVYEWMNGKLNSAYNYQRFASNSYGNTMVDLSLLNYNDRHGFDSALTMLMPYQYWITRSVMNWGARMIDQPKWFSMYARLNNLIERNKKDFLPTRLHGMIGIPLPYLPEGLGSALFFDPSNQLLPMKQFFNFSEYFERNLSTIQANTINKISELYENQIPYNGHIITREEYQEASLGKGDIYNQIFMETMASDETNTGLSGLVGSLINPNMLVSSALAALAGKQEYISYTPMYKLGNTIRSAGRDTMMENVTNLIGDSLQFGEKKWREMLGAETNDIGSQWVDYWTTRYLADMLFDKKTTRSEVINAIAEGESNPLWQEAYKRFSASEAYKQVGGAFLNDAAQSLAGNKETSVGNLAGTALTSLFGGRTYSSGEEEYRREYALRQQALGNKKAMDAFYKNFPDYKVMGYAYIDDPAERLHKILVDQCNEAYYALPKVQQDAVYNGLDNQFRELFINSDTRATDQIDDYKLIEWTQAMRGNTPNITNETINKPLDDALQFQYYTDSLQGLIDRYERDKKKYFPGIDTIEQGYFNSKSQDSYKALHPELQKYWDWKEQIGMANPELGTYFAEKQANSKVKKGTYKNITDAIYSSFADNKGVIANLKNAEYYGFKLQPWVENKLKIAYTNLGITSPSYDQWIKSLYEDVKANGKITK